MLINIKTETMYNELLKSASFKNACKYIIENNPEKVNRGLNELSHILQVYSNAAQKETLVVTILEAYNRKFWIVHIKGDFIPKKIADEKKFYEFKFLEMLHEFYQPNTLILDIGANIGNHTLYFSKVIGSQVISFEPEPHNCVCLAANVIINDLADSVKLVNFALGSMCGTIQLKMIVNSNYGSFTNIPVKNPHHIPVRDEKSVNVPLKNLDSLFFDKQISIIKLDVEGMEIDVLRGGRQIIEKCLPVLAVECISIDLLKKTEKELISFGYFPMDMFNATPTFIFLSRKNQSHFDCLSRFLRLRSISKAKRVKRKVRDKFSSQQLFSKK